MSKRFPTFDETRAQVDWVISGARILHSIAHDARISNICDHFNDMGKVIAYAWRDFPEHRHYLWRNTKDLLV